MTRYVPALITIHAAGAVPVTYSMPWPVSYAYGPFPPVEQPPPAHAKRHTPPTPTPIPMMLACPRCHRSHVDKDQWATYPHRTHRCESCETEWRPANVPTVGVASLPVDRDGR